MLKNVSGQFVYFSLVSALSGNQVTGASGAISGRKSLDGLSGLIVLSGYIIELGGGSYRANLFDFDTNGNQAGYFFSASGCVPVQYQFDMIDGNASGKLWLAPGQNANLSGVFAVVPIASISGAIGNSGIFATVLKDTISGVIANSGLFVNANVIQSLGIPIFNEDFTVASGSATTITVPDTDSAGSSIPDDGRFDYSQLQVVGGTGKGQVILTTTPTGTARQYNVFSGTMPVAVDDTSKMVMLGRYYSRPVTTAAISGQFVSSFSGVNAVVPPSTLSGVIANSGIFVTVPKATISGVVANSGLFVTATASVDPTTISGVTVTVIKENISGVVPLVGVGFISGLFVTVPIATISGVNAVATATVDPASISGAFVTVPKATISGVNAIVPPDNLSGIVPNVLSGTVWLASGHQTALYSGQLTSPYSGQISKFSFASGVIAQEIPRAVAIWDPVGTNVVASGQSGRCQLNAMRKLTNKWDFATSGYLTVYQEDDTTIAYRQAVTAVSGATPVTGLDTQ